MKTLAHETIPQSVARREAIWREADERAANKPATNRTPLLFVVVCIALTLLIAACTGCQTPVAKSQKTLASIQLTADAAMTLWGSYVAKEQKRCDDLPDGQRELAHAAPACPPPTTLPCSAAQIAHYTPLANVPAPTLAKSPAHTVSVSLAPSE